MPTFPVADRRAEGQLGDDRYRGIFGGGNMRKDDRLTRRFAASEAS